MTERASPRSDSRAAAGANRGLLLSLIAIAVLVATVALRYRPPPPKPATASTEQFSSERATTALRNVLGDQTPHPVGSAANARVRERIVAQLRALGYEPELQRGFSCDEWADCGTAENIVARLPGREPGQAVALTAHYDSVGAGPGASDDGAGVASVLEIARALRVQPQARHDIILLLTDGEEVGLFGARAFIDEHPWAKQVRAAVNLEARGTSGPSFLFETGSANAWAMRLYDGLVSKPITNSIYYTAYKLLPNDTDFTVFKTRDWQGYNFAFTGSVQQYHTPLDDLAHLSQASLQHHGDNALATLLALANAELPLNAAAPEAATTAAESVYLDLLAAGLLRWPVAAAVPAASVALALLLAGAAVLIRRRRLGFEALFWGFASVLAALVLAPLGSVGLIAALRALGALPTRAAGYPWIAQPIAFEIANAAVTATVLVLVSTGAARRAGFWGLWTAAGILLHLAGLASAMLLPGLSFAMLLPCVAMLVFALPALVAADDGPARRALAASPPCAVSVLVLLPTLWFLYETLGLSLMPAVALLVAWMLLLLLPLLAGAGRELRRGLLLASAMAGIASAGIAARQPVYTPDAPQRLNFEYWLDADSGQAEWLARPDSGQLPAALLSAAPFLLRGQPPLPWNRSRVFSAPAPTLEAPPPVFEVLGREPADGGKLRYRAKLSSPRGASMASVCFAPAAGLANRVVGGYRLPPETGEVRAAVESRRGGWHCLADHTLTAVGVELQFDLAPAGEPIELIVSDRSSGLPAGGESLIEARPLDATRSQDGDVTRVTRHLKFEAADALR
ncbi:MAG: M20/M25/M40 family metallo-hydrolase [Nevskia sp.]